MTPRCARLAPSLRAGAAGFAGLRYPPVAYGRYAEVGCLLGIGSADTQDELISALLARRSQRGYVSF